MRYYKLKRALMAKLLNLGAGTGLARGERCEGVKKESCIKRQDTQLNFCITNMIIRRDLKYAVNNGNMWGDIELLARGLAHVGRTIRKRC